MPGLIAGVDEVGRGPLAGPVVAAAVILDGTHIPDGLNDSKKLSAGRRIELFAALTETATIGIGAASVAEISHLNIRNATFLAMQRAVKSLCPPPARVLVDGNAAPDFGCPATPVIGGDARCESIAAASIVAKVIRDRLMVRLAARFQGYGWERNMGYPTQEHRDALARLGATPHHRPGFAPVAQLFDFNANRTGAQPGGRAAHPIRIASARA